ncbi:MAG: T9SS type A sorting domain-containing protein, partial [Saprospiraceae bacterium]
TIDKAGNLIDVDPQFADPANGDFTVGNADLHTAADDGQIIGALYWLPGYQDDFADLSTSVEEQFVLDIELQMTPNPFTEKVQVQFNLEERMNVQLEIYNVTGQLITAQDDETLAAGFHTKEIAAADLKAGVYFFKLRTSQGTATTKMIKVD